MNIKKLTDEELRKKLRDNDRLKPNSLVPSEVTEAARRWYNINPPADDFVVSELTEQQMRDLITKDRKKWQQPFTEELIKRGYTQSVYFEIRYIDGSGDDHLYVILNPPTSDDDYATKHRIDDALLNTDYTSVDKDGEPQDETVWIKDVLMNDIIQRLIDYGATQLCTQDRHTWTVYVLSIDGHTVEIAQTFPHRLSCIIDHHEPRRGEYNDGDLAIKSVFEQVLPEFFGGSTYWSPRIRIGQITVE